MKSSISTAHQDLNVLNRLNEQKNKQQAKPSITIYAKLMGQEITYMHMDESTINNMIMQGKRVETLSKNNIAQSCSKVQGLLW